MDMTVVGGILVVCMLLMLTSGIWVALTLTGLAIIGLSLIENSSIGLLLGTSSWSATTGWSLTALPLFIWMGEILFRTRLSRDLFEGEGRFGVVFDFGTGDEQGNRERALGVLEARIHVPQLLKRPDHQPRSHQKHQRERDLSDRAVP